ncbi:PrsW family intramembrane metalloprotease, partial [Enterococcus faecalis]
LKLFFEQVFARISNAISSHWAYTGIFSTGIASILKKIQIFSKKDIYSFVVAPIILHFLWNSPMNEFSFKGINLLPPILSVVTLLFVLKITLKLLKTVLLQSFK